MGVLLINPHNGVDPFQLQCIDYMALHNPVATLYFTLPPSLTLPVKCQLERTVDVYIYIYIVDVANIT